MNNRFIPLDDIIHNPDDPRELKDSTMLQASIRTIGLQQPLRGYYDSEAEKFVVVVGNTRLTALRNLRKEGVDVPGLKWSKIPFMQDTRVDEDDVLTQAVGANVQKELRPTEIGQALKTLMIKDRVPFGTAIQAFGLTPAQGQNYLALVEAPETVQKKVDRRELSMSAWKAVKTMPQAVQEQVAEYEGRVTVDAAKRIAKKAKKNGQVESQDLQAAVEKDEMKELQEAVALIMRLAKREDSRYQYVIDKLKESLNG